MYGEPHNEDNNILPQTKRFSKGEVETNMPEEKSGGYYAVIPSDVRYDPELKPNAKLLYGELTALSDKKGYCWATNEHFASLFDLSVGTISRLISQLEKRGYIRCEMAATQSGSERRIYAGMFLVTAGGVDEKRKTPVDEKRKRGLAEKRKQNNTELSVQGDNPPKAPPRGRRSHGEVKKEPDWEPERFKKFWDFYPRGESKQKAIQAWDKLRPSSDLIDTMAQALKRQVASEAWRQGIGIPYASTWLNQQRWTDELKTPNSEAPASSRVIEEEGAYYID